MCVVSMVTDHYREKWPVIPLHPCGLPVGPLLPMKFITAEEWEEYQELKRKAAEYDAITNQPDCAKEGVAEWEKAYEDHLRERGLL
jgi:hypothetical protein